MLTGRPAGPGTRRGATTSKRLRGEAYNPVLQERVKPLYLLTSVIQGLLFLSFSRDAENIQMSISKGTERPRCWWLGVVTSVRRQQGCTDTRSSS